MWIVFVHKDISWQTVVYEAGTVTTDIHHVIRPRDLLSDVG